MRLPQTNASVVLCALAVIISGWALFSARTSQVVTFNQPKLMARFVGQLSAHALSDGALREKTDQFTTALNVSLSTYAKAHHVLVLNASDVLAGERDITASIESDVARRMRGHV